MMCHRPKLLEITPLLLVLIAACGEAGGSLPTEPSLLSAVGADNARSVRPAGLALCHATGTAGYTLLNLPEAAAAVHRAHGDVAPGAQVPALPGHYFDATCTPVAIGLTGAWEGVYAWDCGQEHLTGSTDIRFDLVDDGSGSIAGHATYLGETGALFDSRRLELGTLDPDGLGLQLVLKVEATRPEGQSTGFVYNEFDAVLTSTSPDRIEGTTLNGDTYQTGQFGAPDMEGCSHPDAGMPSGTFDVGRVGGG